MTRNFFFGKQIIERIQEKPIKIPERDSFEDFVLDNFLGQDVNRRLLVTVDCDRVLLKPTVGP